ncbi:MAG: hypothetical protein ACYSO4_09735 [Planctomycetota bacterium]|jgi:hypothetical protein
MFQKIALSLICLFTCSFCFGQTGLPDPNRWFLQPVASGQIHFFNNVQVSETLAVWWQEGPEAPGTFYYDGTGIYELRYNGSACSEASLSGSNIVSRTTGGIALHNNGYQHLYEVSDAYYGHPDVYEHPSVIEVIWEAGPDQSNTNVYIDYGFGPECITCNAQSFYNGKRPKISADTIAWISNDGNDDEIFMLKDGAITQLTHNDIDDGYGDYIFDEGIHMADDGTMAWFAWPIPVPPQLHYYDGENIHQLAVGGFIEEIWGISEMGVLYSAADHPDYPEHESVLLLHDGAEELLVFGTEAPQPDGLRAASIGGYSIAWIGRQTWTDNWSVNLLKGQELVSWPLPFVLEPEVGVWGNRLVWTPEVNTLYFGRYLDSPACVNPPVMDGNNDCQVNLADYAILASEWLFCGYADQSACQ